MKLHLILYAIFAFASSFITLVESKSYVFTGDGWKNEIRKCASGGEDHHTYDFTIGTLDLVGLKYEDINESINVIAYGDLKGHTGAVDNGVPSLQLKVFKNNGGVKTFYGSWGFKAVAGWAVQIVNLQLTVKFMENGRVVLTNYVSAYSMMAVTCAQTTSYVNKLEIVIN